MNSTVFVGVALITIPAVLTLVFAALASIFDYPDILRRPTEEVLARFHAGGTRLVTLWWIAAMATVVIAPVAVLLSIALVDASGTIRTVSAVVGALAALVQFLALVRWPFLVPYLARVAADTDTSEAKQDAVDVVFQSFNRYLGVAVGEHLGFLLTGTWTALVGVAVTQSSVAPGWIGIVGIVVGVLLAFCSLEHVGPFERSGWKLVGKVRLITGIMWCGWLIALGIALLV